LQEYSRKAAEKLELASSEITALKVELRAAR
jgi:hypothetical protein